MNILILDNFDSFTFNLYQYAGEILEAEGIDFEIIVRRNNEITLVDLRHINPEKIIISSGPGDPGDPSHFGICADVLTKVGRKIPILGVCLGMQGMAHYFGGRVVRARVPMHGKTSLIKHDGKGVFKNLPQSLEVMRYHSLVIDHDTLPDCLEISAAVIQRDLLDVYEIMGLRHRRYPLEGIQFHLESFGTEGGSLMMRNFLLSNEHS